MTHREIHVTKLPNRGKPTAEWGGAVVATLVEPVQESSEVPASFHTVANPVHVHWGRSINDDAEIELCLATVDLYPDTPALLAPLVDAEACSGGSDNQRNHRDHEVEHIAGSTDRKELTLPRTTVGRVDDLNRPRGPDAVLTYAFGSL